MFTLQYRLGLRKRSEMVATSVAWFSKEFKPWLSSARKLPHALRQVRSCAPQHKASSEVRFTPVGLMLDQVPSVHGSLA